jgi:hypothetical protein
VPYYEFYCPENHRIYTFFARSLALAGKVPRCPDDPAWPLVKMPSRFAVTGRATEKLDDSLGGEDDPGMERMMAEMEREMAGLDENNPDPRQLARLMRRITEATGEATPPVVEEMLQRMESGEDPEALEQEYGDALEAWEPPQGGESPAGQSTVARIRRHLPPTQDSRVFDMADWVAG